MIVKWDDVEFGLFGNQVYGIEDLSITGSCETEEHKEVTEKYVKSTASAPYEISMTGILDAQLGADVKKTALRLTEAARLSEKGYFYTGDSKLFACRFMMLSAEICDINMNPKGAWLSCKVKMKLKQCDKYSGKDTSSSSSGRGSSGSSSSSSSSSKKASTKKSKITTISVDAVSSAAPNAPGSSKVTSPTTLSAETIAQMQSITMQWAAKQTNDAKAASEKVLAKAEAARAAAKTTITKIVASAGGAIGKNVLLTK